MSTFGYPSMYQDAAPGSKRPIFFLDIDGVLAISPRNARAYAVDIFKCGRQGRPDVWTNLFCRQAVANLHQLHTEFRPTYVLTSSWAADLTRAQMQEVLEGTGLRFVAEHMHEHWTTLKWSGSPRLWEIERWIALHDHKNQPTLVIDDDESGWSLHESHLDREGKVLLCDLDCGFDAAKLAEGRKLLRAQTEVRRI